MTRSFQAQLWSIENRPKVPARVNAIIFLSSSGCVVCGSRSIIWYELVVIVVQAKCGERWLGPHSTEWNRPKRSAHSHQDEHPFADRRHAQAYAVRIRIKTTSHVKSKTSKVEFFVRSRYHYTFHIRYTSYIAVQINIPLTFLFLVVSKQLTPRCLFPFASLIFSN